MILAGLAALLGAAAVLYAARLGTFARGLRRVLAQPLPPLPTPPPRVSVVVPARNEAARLDACLGALTASSYPASAFEIVVVDDFSTDDTARIAEGWAARRPNVRLLRLAGTGLDASAGHKGAALAAGIRASTGTLVLTTDADCTADAGWVDALARMFASEAVGFVAGWVRMTPGRSWLGRMQALEFAGLVGVGAGALGAGDPNMCNSASMAYPRAVFDALSPADESARTPWDDERLLHAIAAHPTLEARFCPSFAATVTTTPEPTFSAYFAQRRRWAATGAQYDTPGAAYTARLTWAFNVLLVAGLPLLAHPRLWPVWPLALAAKVASEALVLVPTARRLGLGALLWQVVPQQLAQVPLTVALGVATLWGQPAWKGRRASAPVARADEAFGEPVLR